jgi:hypothetical protein
MKILPILLLTAGLTMGVYSAVQAADDDHLDEAMKHAKEAAAADDGPSVAKHAELARSHAKTADEHLDAAIKSLDSAMEHGKLGHADMAKKAAEDAQTHLKAVDD